MKISVPPNPIPDNGATLTLPETAHTGETMQTHAFDFVKIEHLDFLDDLKDSGTVNMFHARPYLMREFPDLTSQEASLVLSHWLQCNPDFQFGSSPSPLTIS